MSKSKILTKAIAEQYLEDEDSVNTSHFTSIEDAAAQALSQHQGWLYLAYLTSLSDKAAEALAQHKGVLNLSDKAKEPVGRARKRLAKKKG